MIIFPRHGLHPLRKTLSVENDETKILVRIELMYNAQEGTRKWLQKILFWSAPVAWVAKASSMPNLERLVI